MNFICHDFKDMYRECNTSQAIHALDYFINSEAHYIIAKSAIFRRLNIKTVLTIFNCQLS